MAVRVAARFPLTVWNRTGARATELAAEVGARAAATPREAVAGAAIVITCLPTSAEVEALLDGPDGLLAGLAPGALLVDCTSGDPATSRRIAGRLEPLGLRLRRRASERRHQRRREPVPSPSWWAATRSCSIAPRRSSRPSARASCAWGRSGPGHAMKAVNNALLAVNILAVGEGLAALVKAGVPARTALNVLNASSGRSFVSETLVPERVLTGAFPRTFKLTLLQKDAGIAAGLLRDTQVSGPMIDLAFRLYGEARARLGDGADYLEAIKVIEQQAGVEIRG